MNHLTKKIDHTICGEKLEYGMDSLFLWYCVNVFFVIIFFVIYRVVICVRVCGASQYPTNTHIFALFTVITKHCIGWKDKESVFSDEWNYFCIISVMAIWWNEIKCSFSKSHFSDIELISLLVSRVHWCKAQIHRIIEFTGETSQFITKAFWHHWK